MAKIKATKTTKTEAKESQIQSEIIRCLNDRKIFNFKTIACNKRGIPDVFCLYKGVPIFFEIKTSRGKPTDLQTYQMNKIKDAGGKAYIVRSVDDVKAILASERQSLKSQN